MVPTAPALLEAGDDVARPPSRRHRWWAIPLAVLGLGAPAAVLVANGIEVDRYANAPGTADDVESRLTFTSLPAGVTVDESPGEFLFVTVSGPHFNALQWLLSNADDDLFIQTKEQRFGKATPTQEREIGLQMMRDAKDVAEYIAYRRLGYGGDLKAGEIVVERLLCLNGVPENDATCDQVSPAGKFLERGSTITAVDGVPTPTSDDLAPVMAKHRPGDEVTVRYRAPRETEEREGTFTTIATPDKPERALIGFIAHDTTSVELPFEANIDTNRIGGPSAGLAFTLTLIDQLSPGSLTGGRKVAVTGTIQEDGSVGAIGGLHQKVVAVKLAGAKYFIVPFDQGEDGDNGLAMARRVAGKDLEIVPVHNLEEALAALAARGGTPIPAAPVSA